MSEATQRQVRRQVRSPRSAAIAGILFSLFSIASMILLYNTFAVDQPSIGWEWLEGWKPAATAVLVLIPFTGIAFLWFTGVMRDLLGDLEDKFFSTIFFGSGIILVVMLFIWAATLGALISTYSYAARLEIDIDILIYTTVFMDQIIGNFFLRMAAVYMLSIGSLWTRTKAVPNWLIILTYIVGLAFLLLASILRWARFVFPAWVLLVSFYILVLNYRYTREKDGVGARTFDL